MPSWIARMFSPKPKAPSQQYLASGRKFEPFARAPTASRAKRASTSSSFYSRDAAPKRMNQAAPPPMPQQQYASSRPYHAAQPQPLAQRAHQREDISSRPYHPQAQAQSPAQRVHQHEDRIPHLYTQAQPPVQRALRREDTISRPYPAQSQSQRAYQREDTGSRPYHAQTQTPAQRVNPREDTHGQYAYYAPSHNAPSAPALSLARAPARKGSDWMPVKKCRGCEFDNPVTTYASRNVPCGHTHLGIKCPGSYTVTARDAQKARDLVDQLEYQCRSRYAAGY